MRGLLWDFLFLSVYTMFGRGKIQLYPALAKSFHCPLSGFKNNFSVQPCLFMITHTHTQPFYGSVEFVRENPGEPVPEEH